MTRQLFSRPADGRQAVTDGYLLVMLLIFPLFTGVRGYAAVTASKYLFFVTATCLWLLALAVLTLTGRRRAEEVSLAAKAQMPPLWCVVFPAACCLSALVSPFGTACLIGAGRFDGLVTQLLLFAIFFGVSRFGRFRHIHAAALAVSATVCCLVAFLQLLGYDPLWLFPGELCYYDAYVRFPAVFLGTVGNADLYSAFLCLAFPLFLSMSVSGRTRRARLYLLPLFFSVAGLVVSGVSGGLLAAGLCALLSPILLVRDLACLRRWLVAMAVCLLAAAPALAFRGELTGGVVAWDFFPNPRVIVCLILAAVCLALCAGTLRIRRAVSETFLRRFFLALAAAVLLLGLAAVWFTPARGGTVYELSQAMRGHLEDSYGSSRVRIWRAVLALIPERPLLGGGPGSLTLRLDIEFSRFVPETGETLRTYVDNAHNQYLQLLADTGAAGLAGYVLLLACTLAHAAKKHAPQTLALLCYCLQDFFGLGLCLVSPVFWAVLGLSLSGSDV